MSGCELANSRTPRCRRTSEQTIDAEIFIDIRPVDTETRTGHLPVCSLSRGCRLKPWVPGERHGNGPAVHEIYDQRISSETDIFDPFSCLRFRDTHSKPPRVQPRFSARGVECCLTLGHQTRDSLRAKPAPAKTWRIDRLGQRARAPVRSVRDCESKTGTARYVILSESSICFLLTSLAESPDPRDLTARIQKPGCDHGGRGGCICRCRCRCHCRGLLSLPRITVSGSWVSSAIGEGLVEIR